MPEIDIDRIWIPAAIAQMPLDEGTVALCIQGFKAGHNADVRVQLAPKTEDFRIRPDDTGPAYILREGRQTLEAAKRMGRKKVECVVVESVKMDEQITVFGNGFSKPPTGTVLNSDRAREAWIKFACTNCGGTFPSLKDGMCDSCSKKCRNKVGICKVCTGGCGIGYEEACSSCLGIRVCLNCKRTALRQKLNVGLCIDCVISENSRNINEARRLHSLTLHRHIHDQRITYLVNRYAEFFPEITNLSEIFGFDTCPYRREKGGFTQKEVETIDSVSKEIAAKMEQKMLSLLVDDEPSITASIPQMPTPDWCYGKQLEKLMDDLQPDSYASRLAQVASRMARSESWCIARLSDWKEYQARTRADGLCRDCKLPCVHLDANGACADCSKKHIKDFASSTKPPKKTSPAERGLVRCLEPDCPVWIKDAKLQLAQGKLINATDYFCRKHKFSQREDHSGKLTSRVSDFPIADRDGDPIWITRELDVRKIKSMDDGHLTNTILMLERSARRRCILTGIDEEKWEERTDTRYAYLVSEAKSRDERLKDRPCKTCRDGELIESCDDTQYVSGFCSCKRGQTRQAAMRLAREMEAQAKKEKRILTLKVVCVMVASMFAGGLFVAGNDFLVLVMSYLQAKPQ